MTPTAAINATLVQQIAINAPAARIFAALTTPDELLKWWAAEGKFRATQVESDLRPGGKWLMRVASDRGSQTSCTTVRGEYRTIEPPHLLIFTWVREEEDHPETVVRWDLEEINGITTVRITHSGLITEKLRTRNNGWPLIVTLLKTYSEEKI
jgi:uncharacterized protein YndB with AHSA1/START domain